MSVPPYLNPVPLDRTIRQTDRYMKTEGAVLRRTEGTRRHNSILVLLPLLLLLLLLLLQLLAVRSAKRHTVLRMVAIVKVGQGARLQ